MEKSFKTAKEFCEQNKKEKLVNYFSFFPERTRQKLSVMIDEHGRSLIRYALAARAMLIVEYLAQEGFLGDDFNRLMYDCAMQGDIDALHIFLNCRPEYFTDPLISDLLIEVSDPEITHFLTTAASKILPSAHIVPQESFATNEHPHTAHFRRDLSKLDTRGPGHPPPPDYTSPPVSSRKEMSNHRGNECGLPVIPHLETEGGKYASYRSVAPESLSSNSYEQDIVDRNSQQQHERDAHHFGNGTLGIGQAYPQTSQYYDPLVTSPSHTAGNALTGGRYTAYHSQMGMGKDLSEPPLDTSGRGQSYPTNYTSPPVSSRDFPTNHHTNQIPPRSHTEANALVGGKYAFYSSYGKQLGVGNENLSEDHEGDASGYVSSDSVATGKYASRSSKSTVIPTAQFIETLDTSGRGQPPAPPPSRTASRAFTGGKYAAYSSQVPASQDMDVGEKYSSSGALDTSGRGQAYPPVSRTNPSGHLPPEHEPNALTGGKCAPSGLSLSSNSQEIGVGQQDNCERDASGYVSSDSVATGKYASRSSKSTINSPSQSNRSVDRVRGQSLPHASQVSIQIKKSSHKAKSDGPLPTYSDHEAVAAVGGNRSSSRPGAVNGNESDSSKKASGGPVPSGKYGISSDVRSRIKALEKKSPSSDSVKTPASTAATVTPPRVPSQPKLSRTVSPNTNFVSPSGEVSDEDDEELLIDGQITSPRGIGMGIPVEPTHSARKSKNNSLQVSPRKGVGSPSVSDSKKLSSSSRPPSKNFYGDSSDLTDDCRGGEGRGGAGTGGGDKVSRKKMRSQQASASACDGYRSSKSKGSQEDNIHLLTQELEKMFTDSSQGEKNKFSKTKKNRESSHSHSHKTTKSSSSTSRPQQTPAAAAAAPSTPEPTPAAMSNLTTAEKKLTSIYFKMKGLGIPFQSIVQKMTLDGLPLELQEKLIQEMSSSATHPSSRPSPAASSSTSSSSLNKHPESGHGQGHGDSNSSSVGAETGDGAGAGANGETSLMTADQMGSEDIRRNMTLLTKTKLQKLHWKPLNLTHLNASSLWCKSQHLITTHGHLLAEPDEQEIKKLEKLFGLQTKPTSQPTHPSPSSTSSSSTFKRQSSSSHRNSSTISSSSSTNHLPQVLDIQRATNISIGLVHFKDLGTIRHIINSICSLNDMSGKLTSDKLLNFSNLLPTIDEFKLLSSFRHTTQQQQLGTHHQQQHGTQQQQQQQTNNKAELFCLLLMEYYPYLPSRLQSFLIIKQFNEMYSKLKPRVELFLMTLRNILSNENLLILMNKMLVIGNILNAGTNIGAAKGFSLSSLAKVITMKATGTYEETTEEEEENSGKVKGDKGIGKSSFASQQPKKPKKKISLIEYTIQSLKEKGFHSILNIVEEIKSIDEICKINLTSLYHEITEMTAEYEFLGEQLQISNDYLLFYYQGALESWQAATAAAAADSSSSGYQIRENDLVNTPYGAGTVLEIKPYGMLKIRPMKWHLTDEVCHVFIIQSSQCTIRPPFEINETVVTHHGPGTIVELRSIDNIAVIKPLTWMKSSFHLPLIYEPIVSLRPYYDPVTVGHDLSSAALTTGVTGDTIPKLTRLYTQQLQNFLTTEKLKYQNLKKLYLDLKSLTKDFLLYFSESENNENHLNELLEILKSFRMVLIPLYEEEQRIKKKNEQQTYLHLKKVKEEKLKIEKEKVTVSVTENSGEVRATASATPVVGSNVTANALRQRFGASVVPPASKPSMIFPVLKPVVPKLPTGDNSSSSSKPPPATATAPAATTKSSAPKGPSIPKKTSTATPSKYVPGAAAAANANRTQNKVPTKASSASTTASTSSQMLTKVTRQYVNVMTSSDDSDTSSDLDDSDSETPSEASETSLSDENDYELWLSQYSLDQKQKSSPQKSTESSSIPSLATIQQQHTLERATHINSGSGMDRNGSDSEAQQEEDSHLTYLNHIQNYIQYLNQNLSELAQTAEHEYTTTRPPQTSSLPFHTSPTPHTSGQDQGYSHSSDHSEEEMRRIRREIEDKYKDFSFSGNIDELLHRREVFGKDSLTSIEMEAIEFYMTHYNQLMALKKHDRDHDRDHGLFKRDDQLSDGQSLTAASYLSNFHVPSISTSSFTSSFSSHLTTNHYPSSSSSLPLPLSASEKFAEFSFANNIEDLLQRRENEGIGLLTSFELEALEYYDRTMKGQEHNDIRDWTPQQYQPPQLQHHQSSSFQSSSGLSLSQYLSELGLSGGNNWQTALPREEEEEEEENGSDAQEEEGEVDPMIAAIRAAHSLMKRTKSLLKDDDQDERRRYAEEIMERLERERIEEARQIMERIEHEIETQGPLTGDETWEDIEIDTGSIEGERVGQVRDAAEDRNEKKEMLEIKPPEQEAEYFEKEITKDQKETESSEKESDPEPEAQKDSVFTEKDDQLGPETETEEKHDLDEEKGEEFPSLAPTLAATADSVSTLAADAKEAQAVEELGTSDLIIDLF